MAGSAAAAPPLLVELGEIETVVPSAPTDCSPLFLSFMDRVEDYLVNLVFFYPAVAGGPAGTHHVVAKLRQALSDVLVPYHFLAGRLSPTKDRIQCNNAGALFVAASCPLSIAALGDVTLPNPEFAKLVHRSDAVEITDQPILSIQVTKFKCGGWSLGVSTRHAALDGIAASEFYTNYASLARGEGLVVEPKPDRSMLQPRVPPQITFEHLEYLKASDNISSIPPKNNSHPKPFYIVKAFPFNDDMLNRLKSLAISDGYVDKCSTFEAMTAHIWRVRTKAINMPPLAPSIVNFAVDFRSRSKPPLPIGFAGE